jgi:hypothetical protein
MCGVWPTEQRQIGNQNCKILDFASGARRNPQKLRELTIAPARTALSNVRGNRNSSPPDLRCKAELFLAREVGSFCVRFQDPAMSFLPRLEVFEVLHAILLIFSGSVSASRARSDPKELKTGSWELAAGS